MLNVFCATDVSENKQKAKIASSVIFILIIVIRFSTVLVFDVLVCKRLQLLQPILNISVLDN